MLRGLLRGYASGSASHELHHMELTSYLRGFQQTFQPSIYLCVYPCTHIYIYTYIERERETRMVFWSKSTAKGQSLAFPSAGDSRWLVQAKALVPWRYGQGCLIFTFMQRCEVSYSRVQNVPGSGS